MGEPVQALPDIEVVVTAIDYDNERDAFHNPLERALIRAKPWVMDVSSSTDDSVFILSNSDFVARYVPDERGILVMYASMGRVIGQVVLRHGEKVGTFDDTADVRYGWVPEPNPN